jgi:hypothetical protein
MDKLMIPGPYAICRVTFPDPSSDSPTYVTLSYGYDTASGAYARLQERAKQAGVPEEECAVIRHIDREEAGEFQA